ncbi:MAG: hypothetical protein JW941_13320 [Candidatus Coatesbacteria bacterium]|nr:hypothetical protein [Candidatus Coatesbacteria bacterium]
MTKKFLEAHTIRSFVSPVGAVAGLLRYLKDVRPFYHLMGLSGFAFRINVGDRICPSSPCAFDWDHLLPRAMMLLGYDCTVVQAFSTHFQYQKKLDEAHALIKRSIDADRPLIGWELDLAEFGVIRGYDDDARVYLIDGVLAEEGEETMPYDRLGRGETGGLFVLKPGQKFETDPLLCAKRAIEYAVFHHTLEAPISKYYETGPAAYGKWMEALTRKEADPFGASYNARVVLDARVAAVSYLQQIEPLFPAVDADALEEAARHFDQVADAFMLFSGVFAFPGEEQAFKSDLNLQKGLGWISRARAEENKAIDALRKITAKGRK